MRTLTLVGTLLLGCAVTGSAQERWIRIADRGSQPFFADIASLRKVDSAVQLDVRSSPGPVFYDIVRYQVRCATLALRTLSRTQYSTDISRPLTDSAGKPITHTYHEDWLTYGPESDGRLLAEAICRLGRDRGLPG